MDGSHAAKKQRMSPGKGPEVVFDAEKHTYTVDGEEMELSVTGF